jgi:hypothetical protein
VRDLARVRHPPRLTYVRILASRFHTQTLQGARETSVNSTPDLVKSLRLVKMYKKNQSSGEFVRLDVGRGQRTWR